MVLFNMVVKIGVLDFWNMCIDVINEGGIEVILELIMECWFVLEFCVILDCLVWKYMLECIYM